MLKVSAQLVGASPRADGSMGLRFVTCELTAKDKLIILEHFQNAGHLLFKEDAVFDVPEEPSKFEEEKSPSRRLRSVMFLYWKQKKSDEEPVFENFYRRAVEKMIEAYKEKLT
jgi:hypothetical protein